MDYIEKKIQCPKESQELAQALVNIVKVIKEQIKDGFQAGQDLPAIVVSAIAELPTAIGGLDKLDDEAKQPLLMAQTFALAGFEIGELFLKKNEA